MRFPLRNSVVQRARVWTGEYDHLGNEVWEWVETQTPVAGWEVPNTDEPKVAGHDRLQVDLLVYAPPGTFEPSDEIHVPGFERKFQIVGTAEDLANPFGWDPGLRTYNATQTT